MKISFMVIAPLYSYRLIIGLLFIGCGTLGLYGQTPEVNEASALQQMPERAALEFSSDAEDIIWKKIEVSVGLLVRGDYRQADKELDEALLLARKNWKADSYDFMLLLSCVGEAKASAGKWDEARMLCKKSLALAEEKYGPESIELGDMLGPLSNIEFMNGNKKEALKLQEKRVRIELKSGTGHAVAIVTALHDLAAVQQECGLLEESMRNLDFASEVIADKPDAFNGPPAHVIPAHVSTSKARNALLKDDLVEANKELLVALTSSKKLPSYELVKENLLSLGIVSAKLKDPKKSAEYLSKCLEDTVIHVKKLLPGLSFSNQLNTIYTEPYNAYHTCLSVCSEFPEDSSAAKIAAEVVANMKGLVCEALSKTATISAASAQSNRAEVEAKKEFIEQKYKFITVDQISQALPKESLLIDFAYYRPFDFDIRDPLNIWKQGRYGAWVYSDESHSSCVFFDLGEAGVINDLINRLRDNIQQAALITGTEEEKFLEANLQDVSEQLYHILLGPILEKFEVLKSSSQYNLIISPDSNLWLIPWSALCLKQNQYLVEKFATRMVLNARSLVSKDQCVLSSSSVVFADPNFGVAGRHSVSNEVQPFKTNYERLSGAAREGAVVSPQIQLVTKVKPSIFFGENAQEKYVRQITRPRIAHFATHAFCNAMLPISNESIGSPFSSSVNGQFRGSGMLLKNLDEEPVSNPWDQCGLLLAGCNTQSSDKENDGVLLGTDILSLDFCGTELVVLSACGTARGDIQLGEGVASLHQAFIIAGADAVLASFWRVGDLTTVGEMSNFYRNCAGGLSYEDALAKTQRAAIKARRKRYGTAHPATWASFGLTTAN